MQRGRRIAACAALASAAVLSGCASTGAATSAGISIVTSTNVYGSIAQLLINGIPATRVSVTSILSDPSIDPHEYEASARNELAISQADLIVDNGGGYDDFMDTLRNAAGSQAPVINAVQLSGHANDPDLNEHVWYDLATVRRVAEKITAFLLSRDRKDATILRRDAASFAGALSRLAAIAAHIAAAHRGTGVAITEPVPLYLLQACGLVNHTPAEFSKAIEDGTDASPRVLQDTLSVFSTHQVKLLVYNAQTAGPQTDQVIAAARQYGIAVIGVTETLPPKLTYPGWLAGILRQIDQALS